MKHENPASGLARTRRRASGSRSHAERVNERIPAPIDTLVPAESAETRVMRKVPLGRQTIARQFIAGGRDEVSAESR